MVRRNRRRTEDPLLAAHENLGVHENPPGRRPDFSLRAAPAALELAQPQRVEASDQLLCGLDAVQTLLRHSKPPTAMMLLIYSPTGFCSDFYVFKCVRTKDGGYSSQTAPLPAAGHRNWRDWWNARQFAAGCVVKRGEP